MTDVIFYKSLRLKLHVLSKTLASSPDDDSYCIGNVYTYLDCSVEAVNPAISSMTRKKDQTVILTQSVTPQTDVVSY